MGAEPWSYFTPYQENVAAALEELKQQEFEAGRYRMLDPDNPPASIEDAFEDMDADGTGSILDMMGVTDAPHEVDADAPHFCMVAPLSTEQLIELYGTDKPARAMVEANQDFYEWIDRGMGISIVVYDGDRPSELYFAGYSFD